MNKKRMATVILSLMLLFSGCGHGDLSADSRSDEIADSRAAEEMEQTNSAGNTEGAMEIMDDGTVVTNGKLPEELALIPQEYFAEAEQQGTLVELSYDTFESMTYGQQATVLHKRAIVYLPYGYAEDCTALASQTK